jgi:hypothetical protein
MSIVQTILVAIPHLLAKARLRQLLPTILVEIGLAVSHMLLERN